MSLLKTLAPAEAWRPLPTIYGGHAPLSVDEAVGITWPLLANVYYAQRRSTARADAVESNMHAAAAASTVLKLMIAPHLVDRTHSSSLSQGPPPGRPE